MFVCKCNSKMPGSSGIQIHIFVWLCSSLLVSLLVLRIVTNRNEFLKAKHFHIREPQQHSHHHREWIEGRIKIKMKKLNKTKKSYTQNWELLAKFHWILWATRWLFFFFFCVFCCCYQLLQHRATIVYNVATSNDCCYFVLKCKELKK